MVTWNLAYWTPGAFNSIPNQQRQWRFLLDLDPDVMLVQECRLEDLAAYGEAIRATSRYGPEAQSGAQSSRP